MKNTRNFCIIAHIDHGKSTLADRLLEMTGTLEARQMREQVLDAMDLERERGITIKAHVVRLNYNAPDGETYELNLIDTPGHVDFTYEVSRSLAACEGAVLVVDAVQGVEAQTVANVMLALEQDLTIVPVINKVDLPSARVDAVKEELEDILGIARDEVILASAKDGTGIDQVLQGIVARIPPPKGDAAEPLKALVIDSFYDSYRGVVMYTRVVNGCLRDGMPILLMGTGRQYDVDALGVFAPHMRPVDELRAGSVGYVIANIKDIRDTKIGDTLTEPDRPTSLPFPGYRELQPLVFCGLYPTEASAYPLLRDALEKLRLNDSSFSFEPETSVALGFGFRCGFLGMLHMEIIQERLEREFDMSLITTAPSVKYRVLTSGGDVIDIQNPSEMPDAGSIEDVEEPYVAVHLVTPKEYIGPLMELCKSRRGEYRNLEYHTPTRAMLHYDVPLNEIVVDFYDRLKTLTRGYGSMDYELAGYRPSDLVRLDILLNERPVDALSLIVHRDQAYYRGRLLVDKLRRLIPRQMFDVPVQAAVGSRVIARETIKALRKNVTAKCYGGDITRKRKLLEKQKEGKRRMKAIGSVEVPQEAFMAVLSTE
ncbi:elongation factor 4 [Candidatus Poribacteria bacterium]|nr:elongation factor 4 [Candidatus Poribacteria bacterium]